MNFVELTRDSVVVDMLFPCCSMQDLWLNDVSQFHSALDAYAKAGVDFVSITVGLDHFPEISFQLREIGRYRTALLSQPEKYRIASCSADIHAAREDGLLAVGLHFQGSNNHSLRLPQGHTARAFPRFQQPLVLWDVGPTVCFLFKASKVEQC